MPGTPPTSPNYGIPRFGQGDAANFSEDVNSVVDTIDENIKTVGYVLQLLTTGTARGIKWGGPVSTSVGLDAVSGRSSLDGQVAHGMGVTPVFAHVFAVGRVAIQEIPGYTVVPAMATTAADATYIYYSATIDGTSNNGFAISWVAIG